MNYCKPLSLPSPTVFKPKPIYTNLSNAHQVQPTPLPPTPPPHLNTSSTPTTCNNTLPDKLPWNALPPPPSVQESIVNVPGTLNVAALRKALSTRQKTIHYEFAYADRDSFVEEINEFMHHQDVMFLREGQELLEKDFASKKWSDSTTEEKLAYIGNQLELLELKNPKERAHAYRKILYIASGVSGEFSSTEEHVKMIESNNKLLFQSGAILVIYQALRVVSNAMDVATRLDNPAFLLADRQAVINLATIEANVCLSILYFMIEVNMGQEKLAVELGEGDIPVSGHLFLLVSQLSESNRKHYPAKKLLLLLWKVLMASFGDTARLLELKNAARALESLPPITQNDPFMKAAPGDYHQLHTTLTNRYPAYILPDARIMSSSPALEGLPLTSYPPSPKRPASEQPAPLQPFALSDSNSNPSYFEETVLKFKQYAYVSLGSVQFAREKALKDRVDFMRSEFDGNESIGTLAEWALSSDEYSDIRGGSHTHGASNKNSNEELNPEGMSSKPDKKSADFCQCIDALERIDKLYAYLLPNLSLHTVMLIRLLYYVNLDDKQNPDGTSPNGTHVQNTILDNPATRPAPGLAEAVRHKEVVTKAVSGILLLLLKATKCRNIFMFEYISHLLLDQNCSILILKLLSSWFQNTNLNAGKQIDLWSETIPANFGSTTGASFLRKKQEIEQHNFFYFCTRMRSESHGTRVDDIYASPSMKNSTDGTERNGLPVLAAENNDEQETRPGSWRNFFTSINLLRVLQKLSKRKPHRIFSLVHWKASAVLKRVVKVGHVGLQIYALKLLKGQIPFLGRKWRSCNMKVITSIYLHLRPYLREDYLTGEFEPDHDEAFTQEHQLRALSSFYHQRVYENILNRPPVTNPDVKHSNHLPTESQDDLDLVLMLHEAGSKSLPSIRATDIAAYRAASQELDDNFIQNYEVWLHSEVFKEESDDENKTDAERDDDEDLWGIRETKNIGHEHSSDRFDDTPPPYQAAEYNGSGWNGWTQSDPLDDEQAAGNFAHAASSTC